MSTGVQPALHMGRTEWFILLFLGAVWGGSFFFVEIAIEALPPPIVVAIRLMGGAVILWGIALVAGHRPPASLSLWGGFLLMGLLNNALPFTLFAWGQTQIASGLAAIFNATTPLFTVLAATLFLSDEKITLRKGTAVLVGFIGVIVMIGPSLLAGLGDALWAQLACLAAGASYAVAAIFGRRFAKLGISPMVAGAGQVSSGALLYLPIAALNWQGADFSAAGWQTWAALGGLVLLSTGLAYGLYFQLLARAGATNMTLVTFLVPLSSILLGGLFLGERLDPRHFAGMALIGFSLALIDGRLLRLLTPRQRTPAI
ncbi:DMT family transporter [Parvularcula marina]|nr:DMT family transporter [Parvularcula marina]